MIEILLIITPAQRSCKGVYQFHSVPLSVCPSIRPASCVCSVALIVLVGSISYWYILSSNFRKCVACKVFCKRLKFAFLVIFLKFVNFDFVLFWLGIWCEPRVWVFMVRRGVSQNAGVLVVLVAIYYMRSETALTSKYTRACWKCVLFYVPLFSPVWEAKMFWALL